MENALKDFEQTVIEVEKYFEFLEKVEDLTIGSPYVSYLTQNSNIEIEKYRIDEQLVKILKANTFLLLYNLVEATIKNAIWEILLAIKKDGILYGNLNVQLKEIWLKNRIKVEFRTKNESLTKQLSKIIESILDNTLDFYTYKNQIKFESGNLNIQTIQEVTKRYGVSENIPITHENQKEAFMKTKRERNHLAHGDKTFANCGKDYPVGTLLEYKNYIVSYLRKTLEIIEKSINEKEYQCLTS